MRILAAVALMMVLGAGRAEADADAEVAMAQDAQSRGLPLAALFHAARAKQLGREVAVDRLDLDTLWSALPTRPRISVGEDCDWLRDPIEAAYPAASANLAIDTRLTCAAAMETWTENQAYVWYTSEQHEETQTVGGEKTTTIGNCWTDTIPRRMYVCQLEVTQPTTTEQVTVTDQIPHDATHDVERRTIMVSVRGTLTSPDGSAQIAFDRTSDEIQFSDEHGSRAFTTTGDDLVWEAMGAVKVGIRELVAPVHEAQIAVELAAAAAAGDKLTGEEHRLRAWTLGDRATKLAKAYRMNDSELAALLVTVGFVVAEDLQIALFLEDQARGERASRPRHRSLVSRFVHAGTAFTLERSTRDGDSLTSLGYGVRIDHGWRLRKTLDYGLGLSASAGTDDVHGTRFDARAGVALGLHSKRYQLAYLLGLGVTGIGVRMVGAAESTLETKPGVFHGVDLRLRAKPFGLDARVTQAKGGPLGDELRASARVVWVFGRYLIGADAAIQQYDGDAELSEAKVTTLGVTFGLEP